MNHESSPFPSSEPSGDDFDEALRQLHDNEAMIDALIAKQDEDAIKYERQTMDALHIVGLPIDLLEECRNALALDMPLHETIEALYEIRQSALLANDLEAEQQVDVLLSMGFIVQRIALSKSMYDDTLDPALAAEVRKEEQLYFLNDKTLSGDDREKVLRAINLLYEENSGLDMGDLQTLLAAARQQERKDQGGAIVDASLAVRDMLETVVTDYMSGLGITEHDDKDAFISGIVVAISREYAVDTGLAAVDEVTAESVKFASEWRLSASRDEAHKIGLSDEQFDDLIARLRNGPGDGRTA